MHLMCKSYRPGAGIRRISPSRSKVKDKLVLEIHTHPFLVAYMCAVGTAAARARFLRNPSFLLASTTCDASCHNIFLR